MSKEKYSCIALSQINQVKSNIESLYKKNQTIHILFRKNKVTTENEAQITGVYPNFFGIKTISTNTNTVKSVQYIDIILDNVSITELSNT